MAGRYIDDDLRKRILKRDGNQCRYCGKEVESFHLDHVYPFSKGGETTYENLVVSCQMCNLKKHNSVGMWPKPVGYFKKEEKVKYKKHSPLITLVTMFGIIVMVNGVLFLRGGLETFGSILFVIGMAISYLSATANITRPQ